VRLLSSPERNLEVITKTRTWAALSGALLCVAFVQPATAQPASAHAAAGKDAGKQHAIDLGKRNLATNYVNCGIRGSMAMATTYKVVTIQERSAFLDAFESTCVGQEAKQAEPVGQLIPTGTATIR
jgi:hypothetical protein